MRKLPTGISEFTELRRENCLYIDKTKHIYALLTNDRRTFLARPRRFGKSLLVSTLTAALQGEKKLFEGLWIFQSDYHWKSYGVIRLDFSALDSKTPEIFEQSLMSVCIDIAQQHGYAIGPHFTGIKEALKLLTNLLHKQFGRVALLIDEYDYPILQNLPSPEQAIAIRSIMKDFSTSIKALQLQIEFVFITSVSAFSKSDLSSGLNNLTNLTMMDKFATICGYTDEEIDFYFTEHISRWKGHKHISIAQIRDTLRTWYNGYHFTKTSDSVYSPFSVISALDREEIASFWFESATPQFLLHEIERLERKEECSLLFQEGFIGSMETLQTFEIESIPLMALLFQTGYLTIDRYDAHTDMYTLTYPNFEVKKALHQHLMIARTK